MTKQQTMPSHYLADLDVEKQLISFKITGQHFLHLFDFLTSTNLQLSDFFFSGCGQLLQFWTFLTFLRMWTTTNCLLLHLTLTDMAMATLNCIPRSLLDYHFCGHINFNYYHHFNWHGHGNNELYTQVTFRLSCLWSYQFQLSPL